MQTRLCVVALLVVAIAFAGCDRTMHEIVGRWQVTSDTSELVWDFAADGVVTSGDMRGHYSFDWRGRLKLQTSFGTFSYVVKITGDTMTWTNPRGEITELARMH